MVAVVCILKQMSSSKASWKGKKPVCHLLFQQILLSKLEPLIRSAFTMWKGWENVAAEVATVCLLRQLLLSSSKASWKGKKPIGSVHKWCPILVGEGLKKIGHQTEYRGSPPYAHFGTRKKKYVLHETRVSRTVLCSPTNANSPTYMYIGQKPS